MNVVILTNPRLGTGINVKKKGQLENQPKTGPSLEKNVLQRKRSKSKIRYQKERQGSNIQTELEK